MKRNIGTKDRILRLIFAIVCFVAITFVDQTSIKIILLAFGLFNIFQATFSWCALYALLGKNTCPIQR